MLEKKTVSQCISSDYCEGWNDAIKEIPDDLLERIQQLEEALELEKADHQHTYECAEVFQKENAELVRKSEQLERERDAAIFDLTHYSMCKPCKHFSKDIKCLFTDDCLYGTKGHFEWRGPCEENTENP